MSSPSRVLKGQLKGTVAPDFWGSLFACMDLQMGAAVLGHFLNYSWRTAGACKTNLAKKLGNLGDFPKIL